MMIIAAHTLGARLVLLKAVGYDKHENKAFFQDTKAIFCGLMPGFALIHI